MNILILFLNLYTVCTRLIEVNLTVPHLASSVYKATKHFGLSFANDALKIYNDLPDNVQ